MAIRARTYPGVLALLEPRVSEIVGDGRGRIESPPDLAHQVVGEFALELGMTPDAGRCGIAALRHRVLQRHFEVPLHLAGGLIDDPVLRQHEVLEFVVVDAVVARRAGFRHAGFGRGEAVAGMAAVALVLLVVAHVATLRHLALRHRRPDRGVHVRLPVHGMGGLPCALSLHACTHPGVIPWWQSTHGPRVNLP